MVGKSETFITDSIASSAGIGLPIPVPQSWHTVLEANALAKNRMIYKCDAINLNFEFWHCILRQLVDRHPPLHSQVSPIIAILLTTTSFFLPGFELTIP